MDEIIKIFETIKKINLGTYLLEDSEINEQEDNISDLPELKERLNHIIEHINKKKSNELISSNLVHLHLYLCDMEWQFDQIHDLVRKMIEKNEKNKI